MGRCANMVRMGDFTGSGVVALDRSMALFESLGGVVFGTPTVLFETSMALFDRSDDCGFDVAVALRMTRDGRTGADESVRAAAVTGTAGGGGFDGPDVDDRRDMGSGTEVFSALAACRFAAIVSLRLGFGLGAADLAAAAVAAFAGAGTDSVLSVRRGLRCGSLKVDKMGSDLSGHKRMNAQ